MIVRDEAHLEELVAAGRLTAHDAGEVRALQRYLALELEPPFGGDEAAAHPGWVPYVYGIGGAPPEGLDDVPLTAWTWPS